MLENKVQAVYALREAAENHAKIEAMAGESPTPSAKGALLDARIELEQKTREAIEACAYCGRPHADDDSHGPSGGAVVQFPKR